MSAVLAPSDWILGVVGQAQEEEEEGILSTASFGLQIFLSTPKQPNNSSLLFGLFVVVSLVCWVTLFCVVRGFVAVDRVSFRTSFVVVVNYCQSHCRLDNPVGDCPQANHMSDYYQCQINNK